MTARTALIVGLGTVGLPLALRLGQAGWSLILCDPDRVEPANLTKQRFDHADVGRRKIDAAFDLIARHTPDARIERLPRDVRTIGVGLAAGVDLVAACVDNRAAEIACARLANLAGADYVRLATRGADRVADVTFAPAPCRPTDPCGVCSFTARDFALAEARESCVSDVEIHAEAGATIFAEHGSIAAAVAADAILRGELAPARLVRFRGGVTPEVTVIELGASRTCRLDAPPWSHGPVAWTSLDARAMRVADIVGAAARALGARADQLAVELDAPLCIDRVCSSCSARLGAAFWIPGALACPSCSGVVRQRLHLVQQRFAVAQLAGVLDRTLDDLGAPLGLGMRFASSTSTTWNAYAAPERRREES